MDLFHKETDQLPYSLHRLSSLLQRLADELLRSSLNMSSAQAKVLLGVASRPGCEQKQLAVTLGLTEAGISRQVSVLKRRGWLEVQVNRKDARRRNLYLTAQGKHSLVRAQRALDTYHKQLFQKLPRQKIDELERIISQLTKSL